MAPSSSPERENGKGDSPPPPTLERRRSTRRITDTDENALTESLPGVLRGVAAATRKLLLPVRKVLAAKGTSAAASAKAQTAIRVVGENRPLAFASEGAVAGESMLPRVLYYGAWTLSGAAIAADIYNKQEDAPPEQKWPTVLYWTTFHVPASLVVPAVIIHRIVHTVQHAVEHQKFAQSWSPRMKAGAPVVAALLSIIPVVPVVDTVAEHILEPTLGAYLGLEFEEHHDNGHDKKSN